ncbi:hypothetical protein CHS0354_016619 [Potamilus streckersoni]|uniref:Uncharacterized protein n=1 Tax=Potamilus streckersoni TaxID=2493646 RepID=A0AAE0WEA8_9BIVA|nr:hypothetical protein CHS0354_016619 [Potamilus streckersoni]
MSQEKEPEIETVPNGHTMDEAIADITGGQQDEDMPLVYKISDSPPIHLTLFFGFQQALLSIAHQLAISLLVAEVVCASHDDEFKARLLSSTLFMTGLTTLLMVTVGARLPLFQGAAVEYLAPLLALGTVDPTFCTAKGKFENRTLRTCNLIQHVILDFSTYHIEISSATFPLDQLFVRYGPSYRCLYHESYYNVTSHGDSGEARELCRNVVKDKKKEGQTQQQRQMNEKQCRTGGLMSHLPENKWLFFPHYYSV